MTAQYGFLPWTRQGLGTRVSGTATGRATVQVGFTVQARALDGSPRSAAVSRTAQLYGPGDVVGLDAAAIIATNPAPATANAEPNYLASVDFYEEDLPWRYTPAAPSGDRLVPWLTLAVLAEGEFDEIPPSPARPLPAVLVKAAGTRLPPTDQLWAWAHVHTNAPLGPGVVSGDGAAVSAALDALVGRDGDLAYSRIIGPRRLAPGVAYHALLIPTFEGGRRAGLGENPDAAGAAIAWTDGDTDDLRMPFYHRWSFRTGAVGDFEYLVRLLKPRPPDPAIGRRPMDTLDPGSGLPAIDVPGLGGVLGLGGALKVPDGALDEAGRQLRQAENAWDGGTPGGHPFGRALADLINLAGDAVRPPPGSPGGGDPVITPPLYGQWPALTVRLLDEPAGTPVAEPGNWVHRLNLDPRYRVAAGLGTGVVQRGQEDYMAAAWAQLGRVIEANRLIRLARLSREVAGSWHDRHLRALAASAPERALTITQGVHARVLDDGATVRHRIAGSRLAAGATTPAMRRVLRPGGPVARRVAGRRAGRQRPDVLAGAVLAGLATGEISPAPPRPDPAMTTQEELVARLARAVRQRPGGSGEQAAERLRVLLRWYRRLDGPRPGRPDPATPVVESLPAAPGFDLVPLERDARPGVGERDSPVAERFKSALRDSQRAQAAAADAAARTPAPTLPVRAVVDAVTTALDPGVTFPRRLRHTLSVPDRLIGAMTGPAGELLDEVMAHPVIDTPMYEPLIALSDEAFLPNLNRLANNSITLLETNQPFIESYLAGLNHEMSRELLWREYPTDQRGTPFRQFWDPREQLRSRGDTEAARESLRDIPPMHRWRPDSALGDHDHRDAGGVAEDELVLVIRGELLKRYPTAVVYAHKADWARRNGVIDRTLPRTLVPLTGPDETTAPPGIVRLPSYGATVAPDIFFRGFDLTQDQARGENGDAGWFFVIKERPGQPRFGLDQDSELAVNRLATWNDLAWEHVQTGQSCLRVGPQVTLVPPPASDPVALTQHDEDRQVRWSAASNAAEVAYVLYQVPVMVAVHTTEILRERP